MGLNFNNYPCFILKKSVLLIYSIAFSWLSYTIIDQQKQIEQLEQQLQHEDK